MTIGRIRIDGGNSISFHSSDGNQCRDWTKDRFVKQYFDMIVCIVQFDTLMVYDITLPDGIDRKNVVHALQNELEYLLPLNPSEIVWGYRNNGENKFSIYVLRKEKFTTAIDYLKQQKLQCDILYPVQCFTNSDLAALKNFYPVSMQVPKDIRPIRNKLSRIIYWLLLLIALLLLNTAYIEKYNVYNRKARSLSAIVAQDTEIFRSTQQVFGKLSSEKELFDKINNLKLSLHPVLPLLQELSQMLPEHMWVINYVQHGEIIDITIESSKDEPNFFRYLSGAKKFQVISLRKSRGNNSAVIFYVKLKGDSR